jgi:hypothetical protein
MEWSPADIIDRMSIVKLKIEKIGLPELQKEFDALQKALDDFKRRGIKIKEEWLGELYEINKEEWNLLEVMNAEKGTGDFEKIGKLYIQTEGVNKKRSVLKNEIVRETGEGFVEIKKNHLSE